MGLEFGKKFIINTLYDYGIIDLRDQTLKAIDEIKNELKVINTKIDNIDKKMDIQNAEKYVNDVIECEQYVDKLKPFFNQLGDIIKTEEDIKTDADAEKADQQRKKLFNGLNNTITDGLIATNVIDFAKAIKTPNPADDTAEGNLFHYYDLTLGKHNKWTYQEYTNKRAFINELAANLLIGTTIAKIDLYYKEQQADEIMKGVYEDYAKDLNAAVKKANEIFQTELIRLDKIEQRRQDEHIETYLPTGKEYKNRLATLTFDLNCKDGNQAFIVANDGLYMGEDKPEYVYNPNQNFVKTINEDFKAYKNAYEGEDYTINDYLKDAGFYAYKDELFDKAAGLYYGNLYHDRCDYLDHDTVISATYFDQNGDYQRKNIYRVNVFHDWMGNPSECRIDNLDNNYYFCFVENNAKGQEQLVGNYETNYFNNTWEFKLIKKVFYHVDACCQYARIPALTNGQF
jgi:division protein CdvB (Snf7/Vps24/ESCRT-III family)